MVTDSQITPTKQGVTEASTAPPPDELPLRLGELDIAQQEGENWEFFRDVQMNGLSMGEAFLNCEKGGSGCYEPSTDSFADIVVGRQHEKLTGLIGMTDRSPANCTANIRILLDNRLYAEWNLVYGQFEAVEIPITNVLRIRFQSKVVNPSTNPPTCYVGLGDPFLS